MLYSRLDFHGYRYLTSSPSEKSYEEYKHITVYLVSIGNYTYASPPTENNTENLVVVVLLTVMGAGAAVAVVYIRKKSTETGRTVNITDDLSENREIPEKRPADE